METLTKPTPVYTTLDEILNVKVSVPAMGAPWMVGVMNTETHAVTPLGKKEFGVKAGLKYQAKENEIVIFTVGTLMKGSPVVVNRTFVGLKEPDFGKNGNFTAEIKNKQIEDRNYTSISLAKTNGSWTSELRFSENGEQTQEAGEKDYTIAGAPGKIRFIPIHQPQPPAAVSAT